MKILIAIGCLTAGLLAGGGTTPPISKPIPLPIEKPCGGCPCNCGA